MSHFSFFDSLLDALEQALQKGTPTICNTDQGSLFTAHAFIDRLLAKNIRISMNGRGRALANIFIERFWRTVKYADIYLKKAWFIFDEMIFTVLGMATPCPQLLL